MNTDDRTPDRLDRDIREAYHRQRSRITAHVDARRGLDQIKEPTVMSRRVLRPALGAAAIAIVAIGLVLVLQPFGGTEQTAGSTTTVPGTTTTTVPATTTTIPGTTTTTIPGPVAGWEDARYRVVGVAADDVLNVRQRAGASNPIVGTLPPDGFVRLSSWPSMVDGSLWYGVMLDDGTQGFVNGEFLAPPAAWATDFTALACDDRDAAYTTGSGRGPAPGDASDAAYVLDVLSYREGDCERFVIVFGASENVEVVTKETVHRPAAEWPAGVAMSVEGSIVAVDLPGVPAATPWAQTREANGSLGLATRAAPLSGDPGSLTMRFFFDSNRRANFRFLTEPARIVVDVRPAPTGTGLEVAAKRGATTVVLPIQVDVNGPGLIPPITVNGWSRPFEATGVAILRTVGTAPGAGELVEATFSGTDFAGTVTAPSYPYMTTDWTEAWGAFQFTIEELAPGTYELFVGELSMEDGAEQGVYQVFTVG